MPMTETQKKARLDDGNGFVSTDIVPDTGMSFTPFTAYRSTAYQDKTNVRFPAQMTVKTLDDLKILRQTDHTTNAFNGTACKANWTGTDCLFLDVDNSAIDDPSLWIKPQDVMTAFPDVECLIIPSRNHMVEKNGQAPRPKFHCYFPLKNTLTDRQQRDDLTAAIVSHWTYPSGDIVFDDGAMDSARKVFGADPEREGHDIEDPMIITGSMSIAQYMALHGFMGQKRETYGPGKRSYTQRSSHVWDGVSVLNQGDRYTQTMTYLSGWVKSHDASENEILSEIDRVMELWGPPMGEQEQKDKLNLINWAMKCRNQYNADPDYVCPELFPAKSEMQKRIDSTPQLARFNGLTGIEKAILNDLWTGQTAPVLVKALNGQSHKSVAESADRIMDTLAKIGYGLAGKKLIDMSALPDMITNILRLSPLIERSRHGLTGLPALAQQAVQRVVDTLPEPSIYELLKKNPKTKGIEPSARNVSIILENDRRIPTLRRNLMTGETELDNSPVPWNRGGKTDRIWSLDETACLHVWLDEEYNFRPKETDITTAVRAVSLKASYHPVVNWFSELPTWDGVPRAETLFTDYLGVEDSPYTRAVTRLFLTAAYQRVHHPGIKMDSMPILIGPQGVGKSTIIRLLACNDDWYSNNLKITDMGTKDAAIALRYSWIFELGEMAGLRKRDDESIRNWLTTTTDKYRAPYGRTEEAHPRQCVLIGTSNERSLLRDSAGNRRYWPLFIPSNTGPDKRGWLLDHDSIIQIWAEVRDRWKDETTLCLPPELEADAKVMQDAAFDTDPLAGKIEYLLDLPVPKGWKDMTRERKIGMVWSMQNYDEDLAGNYSKPGEERRDTVCISEVWDLLNTDKDATNASRQISDRESKQISKIMHTLPGWEPALTSSGRPAMKDFGRGYGRQKYFKRKSTNE